MHITTYFKKFLADFRWNSVRSINSLKTAIACLIGYIIYLTTPLPQSQWIIITILVVMAMQSTFGGLLIKSYLRFLGTVGGTLFSVFIILWVGTGPIAIGIALFVAVLVFTYIAGSPKDISAAGVLGAVTLVIVLLGPNPDLENSGIRFIEILLGILIAVLVSKFILPVRAYKQLRLNIAANLINLQEHYNNSINHLLSPAHSTVEDVEDKIINTFSQQRKLLSEMAAEPGKERNTLPLYHQLLDCQRKIFRDINLMQYCIASSQTSQELISSLPGIEELNRDIMEILPKFATSLETGKNTIAGMTLNISIKNIEEIAEKIFQGKSYLRIASVNSFLFALHALIDQLEKMNHLLGKMYKA